MKKVTTTIEITQDHIKCLQAQKVGGKETITFCDIRATAHCSDEDIAGLLKEMVSSLPAACGELVYLLPRQFVILRQMKLPSNNDTEIEDMIGFKLVNNLPYSIEDMIYRHTVLDQDEKGYSRVLVVIIHRETSRRYFHLLEKAGIKNAKLTISSFGIIHWLMYQEKKNKTLKNHPVIALDIDTHHCEICFFHDKKLFFSRSIPYGGEYLNEGDTDELIQQIKLSCGIYRREHLGPEIGKMLIISTVNARDSFKERLQEELEIPVEVLESLDNVHCVNSVHPSALQVHQPVSLTAVLGLLLSEMKNLPNLAPSEVHKAKQARTERRQWLTFIVVLLMMASLSVSGQFVDLHKKRIALEALEREGEYLGSQVEEASKKIELVQFFDQKLKRNYFIPDLIDELIRLTPKEISFRTLSLDKEKRLIIRGYAQTHSGINDFQARLIQSVHFYDVDLKFVTKRKIANRPVMDFKMAFQLSDDNGGVL